MKVLYICYENMGIFGGSNRQVIEFARHLQKRGHKVKICAPLISRLNQKDINIEYVPVINYPVFRRISYYIISPFFLLKTFLRFRPDCVLYFEVPLELSSLIYCKLFRCPFIFYINGILAEELKIGIGFNLLIFLIESIQRLYVKYSDKILTVTEYVKQYLHNKYGTQLSKVAILKNGVDTEIFKPGNESNQARQRMGIKENETVIGFVGALFSWHGLDYLVRSAPFIIEALADVKFVIVGEGQTKSMLVRLVSEKRLNDFFVFTGAVPFNAVPFYISAFDVAVVFFKPVRGNPGDPIKLYEYLACGKPVVASNVNGYGDFVEGIGAGFSVDANNPKEVAGAVIRIIKDADLKKAMSERGRARVNEKHTWANRAAELEHFLFEISNKTRLNN